MGEELVKVKGGGRKGEREREGGRERSTEARREGGERGGGREARGERGRKEQKIETALWRKKEGGSEGDRET